MIPIGVLASSYVAPAGGGASLSSVDYRYGTSGPRDGSLTTTFASGVSVGDDNADRVLILAVSQRSQTAAPTLTVGGTSATLLASVGSWHYFTFAYPSGTLPTVVATWPSYVQYERVLFVWSAIGTPVAGSSTGVAGATVDSASADFTIGARMYVGAQTGNLTMTAIATNGGWSLQAGIALGAGSWYLNGNYPSVLVLTP